METCSHSGWSHIAEHELWPAFPKRREIAVTCIGSYTRIVLTMSDKRPALEPQPRWA
jgi:hypothetical protein